MTSTVSRCREGGSASRMTCAQSGTSILSFWRAVTFATLLPWQHSRRASQCSIAATAPTLRSFTYSGAFKQLSVLHAQT